MHRGAGAYICGEETALLDSPRRAARQPALKPPFPANQGLYQGPTLINNVETLATVPYILRMGGAEYAKIGARLDPTQLVSVSGNVQRPGNYEIELGSPRGRSSTGWPAGRPRDARSSSGSLAARARRCSRGRPRPAYSFDAMAEAGSMLGSGAIIVVDDSTARRRRAQDGRVLPPRVVRQVRPAARARTGP